MGAGIEVEVALNSVEGKGGVGRRMRGKETGDERGVNIALELLVYNQE